MKLPLVISLVLISTHTSCSQYNDLKRSNIYDNYVDDHCEGHFQLERNTIIRTEDSIGAGGVFLNETSAGSLVRCLHFCCSFPLCNTVVYDDRPDSEDGGSCYLFDCGSMEEIKCQFTNNPGFMSAMLDIDRHKFEMSASDNKEGHSQKLSSLRGRGEVEECGQWQWRCRSGECIPTYDTCNGIPQCADGSDEDPKVCPTPTTLRPHLHLRPDMDPPVPLNQPVQPVQYGGAGPYPQYFYPRPGVDYPQPQPQPAQYNNLQPPFYPQPGYPNMAPPRPPAPPQEKPTQSTTARTTETSKKTTRRRTTTTTTTTTLSPEEKFESELIEQLGDELTEMEMPGFAILTLSLGILLLLGLAGVIVCRIKQGKMGYR